ncbi:MAG: metalloregulator ArsR/SmtB family transcription factor [Clostridia bacterium]
MSAKQSMPVCEVNHIDTEHEQTILKSSLSDNAAVDAAELFSYLSDSTRVRLLSMLATADMCVCEMADILKMSQPAVSHHLRILRQCGIVKYNKIGQRAVYYLNLDETGEIIKKLLTIVCSYEKE